MKKKVDSRIPTLVVNGVKQRHRSLMVIVGDRGRDQVVNLHYMLSKATVRTRPSVLWCYKKDLGFSSNRKKRMKQIKRQVQRGLLAPDQDDPFDLFVSSTEIRYCYYKETHKILGNTFGMCVLQDFEALTPNILARTVETVEGGGLIVILLNKMRSLRQLYSMAMDVHARFRTEAHQDVTGRFNERFLLSLGSCHGCLVMDDELNLLPISSHTRSIVPIAQQTENNEESTHTTDSERELKELKVSLHNTQPIGSLVKCARTLDQAKAILMFVEAISEKTLRSTVALTAARGRGKSAALGLAMAAAVVYGYANIFVTAPSPENLKTLFDFVFMGFDALDYKEHLDYELVQSTNPAFNKAVIRVNVFRSHRQTIQYVQPNNPAILTQAELLVIDEAAAIPLPMVKQMLGPYLVFISSTVNGYEGTGRSLSLKLFHQLRDQAAPLSAGAPSAASSSSSSVLRTTGGRVLREIQLEEPIRYGADDPIEKWLYELLCLDAANATPRLATGIPHPDECDLYYVSRDTLFSYHKASEAFLQRMMSLYVSSHYKNSPNDLQLMSDAPAHHLFVLLGPVDEKQNTLPDVLCVLQVCLEGEISKESVANSLSRGQRASGDLIPWTVSQQFQDNDFPSLSGGRIVRIATHPDLQKMGYGTRALEILFHYYQGEMVGLEEDPKVDALGEAGPEEDPTVGLHAENLQPRKSRLPLLLKLQERPAERLHYLGTSFGVTLPLFKFWRKGGYRPVYVRQTANDLTGEHTCIMIKALRSDDLEPTCAPQWLDAFNDDFKRRFASLLSYDFHTFTCGLALSLLDPKIIYTDSPVDSSKGVTATELDGVLTPYDLKRLDSYAKNLVDYHMVVDLLPTLSRLYFLSKVPVTLSHVQSALLLALGLQHKRIEDVEAEFNLPASQLLALFNKAIRKTMTYLMRVQEHKVETSMAPVRSVPLEPSPEAEMQEKLEEGKRQQTMMLKELNMEQYAITGQEAEWDEALADGKTVATISVKKDKRKGEETKKTKPKPESKRGRKAR